MIDDQTLFITQLLTLWAVLDPVSHLPLYFSATSGLNPRDRRKAAIFAVIFAAIVLTAFGLLGEYLLRAMGISLLSFQISGGIILFLFAVSMVLGEHKPLSEQKPRAGRNSATAKNMALSIAVYPLAIPIIAGPGSMLSMMVLIDNNRFSPTAHIITLLALATALAMLLCVFLAGNVIERVIGDPGIQLLRRVMGLILSALATNLVLNAVAIWLKLPPI